MTVQKVNRALENCLKNQGSCAALVHSLYTLECSDTLITAIVGGAFGETAKERVKPLLDMVRAYENLSSSEQIDMLYSIVDKQDGRSDDGDISDRMSA